MENRRQTPIILLDTNHFISQCTVKLVPCHVYNIMHKHSFDPIFRCNPRDVWRFAQDDRLLFVFIPATVKTSELAPQHSHSD